MNKLIILKGGGDLATGVAHRLHRSGFDVVITEIARPTVIRRTVAFAQAVFTGQATVEDVTALLTEPDDIEQVLAGGDIPLLIDPQGLCVARLQPTAVIDAIMAKVNTGTTMDDAPVVIGIGPGFTAGTDVHAVVETARGHYLGRVYLRGSAAPNTGMPGEIGGYTTERLVRSPGEGLFRSCRSIGDVVAKGETVAYVGEMPVTTAMAGMLRGLLQDGLPVFAGMKVGDVDARCERDHCFTISDKARSIGGGVLEALMCLSQGTDTGTSGGAKTTRHR